MKALILNSGVGNRMGLLTSTHPKCMTELFDTETILSRQLKQLKKFSINQVVITTGLFHDVLIDYCHSLSLNHHFTFVHNPIYDKTNYIYSIYLARELLQDDILLLHGDLVFEDIVLESILKLPQSSMTVSSTLPLPKKDFKAVLQDKQITRIGIDFFDHAIAAQPLYKLNQSDWLVWLTEIENFCLANQVNCYAENAFNAISSKCCLFPYDIKDAICNEIDTPADLLSTQKKLEVLL